MRQASPRNTETLSFNNAEAAANECLRPLREALKKLNSKKFHVFTLDKLGTQLRHLYTHLKKVIDLEFSKETPPCQDKLAAIQKKAHEKSSLIESFKCDADFYVCALSSAIVAVTEDRSDFCKNDPISKEKLLNKLSNIDQELRQKIDIELEKQQEPDRSNLSKILKIQQQYADLGNALISSKADYYLRDLSHAIDMLNNDKKCFKNAAAKNNFTLQLIKLKDSLKEKAEKELSKIDEANVDKLDGIKKMASEHLKMLTILCTPDKSEKRKKSAILECHQNCTRIEWWKTVLRILGLVAFTAVGALLGFIIGHALFPGPGGIAGAIVGMFKAAAWGEMIIATTCLAGGSTLLIPAASLGLASSKMNFFVPHGVNTFTKGVQTAALNAIHAPEEDQVSNDHSLN
jgi:hypothetical protein